jgi:hypothetical protein
MELEKLYTLSQFVKNQHTGTGLVHDLAKMYLNCFKYTNKIDEPYTKEMFINRLVKPDIHNYKGSDCGVCGMDIYNEAMAEWEEAEKKVIFDGYMDGDYYINDNMKYHFHDMLINIETLTDIAEFTNGKLKFKNVML